MNIARPTIDGVSFLAIPLEVQSWLEREFEEAEMSKALGECEEDKAPSPQTTSIFLGYQNIYIYIWLQLFFH